tara:strand:+ start:221 stop:940 length:720 start_codon:yes stop_codon:yes gene_type:complete
MVLLVNEMSTGKKTKGLAITYRAGAGNKFGSCPASCKLNASGRGSEKIDLEYTRVLYGFKPVGGFAFTFSHFDPSKWFNLIAPEKKKAVINYSADLWSKAVKAFKKNIPTVFIVAESYWSENAFKHKERDGVRVVRCPEEYNGNKVSCLNCGGEKGPLCARPDRNFIIAFTAHGNQKKKINDGARGGCYADGGKVNIHWKRLADKPQEKTDSEILRKFIKTIPPRRILRHHIAGDLGQE